MQYTIRPYETFPTPMISWFRGVPMGKCVNDSRKRLVLGRRPFIAVNCHVFGRRLPVRSPSATLYRSLARLPALLRALLAALALRTCDNGWSTVFRPRLLVRCEESRCTRCVLTGCNKTEYQLSHNSPNAPHMPLNEWSVIPISHPPLASAEIKQNVRVSVRQSLRGDD